MSRAGSTRRGERGVTLLELVVTLTVLALVGAIALQAYRLAVRSWERAEKLADAEQRRRILAGILGRDLASALAITTHVEGGEVLAFRGRSEWVLFHAAPTGHGALPFGAMVRSLTYSVEPGRGLVVQESYPLAEGAAPFEPRGAPRVIDPDVIRVRFRYLVTRDSADEGPRWVESWDPSENFRETPRADGPREDSEQESPAGASSGTGGGLPLAVEMTIVRGENRGEHTSSFFFPTRIGQSL